MTVQHEIEMIFDNAKQQCLALLSKQTTIRLNLKNANTSNYHAVVRIICDVLQVDEGELFKRNRHRSVSEARQICVYILNEMYAPKRVELADFFGIDHTSVIYSLAQIKDQLSIHDERTVNALNNIRSKINQHICS